MTFRRTAASTCELGGQRISAGDKVVVSFTSANRDEAVFTGPDRFDIRRRPNPHLVFGHGPHFCLGAHLARTQMRALFAEVLARTSSLRYAGASRLTCDLTSSAASNGWPSAGPPKPLPGTPKSLPGTPKPLPGTRYWLLYSSWRRKKLSGSPGPRASLRPRGARSSHWYMPQRPSRPRP
jgi:hypothetical protein